RLVGRDVVEMSIKGSRHLGDDVRLRVVNEEPRWRRESAANRSCIGGKENVPRRQFCGRGVISSEQALNAYRFAHNIWSGPPFVAGGIIDGGMAGGTNIKDFLRAVTASDPL